MPCPCSTGDLNYLLQVKGEKPPAPTRGNKKSEEGGGDAADEDEGEAGEEAAAAINVADLIPRVDIWSVSYFWFQIIIRFYFFHLFILNMTVNSFIVVQVYLRFQLYGWGCVVWIGLSREGCESSLLIWHS